MVIRGVEVRMWGDETVRKTNTKYKKARVRGIYTTHATAVPAEKSETTMVTRDVELRMWGGHTVSATKTQPRKRRGEA